jgi:hypothetical protein
MVHDERGSAAPQVERPKDHMIEQKGNRAAKARLSFADQGTTGNHLPEGNS